MKILLIKMSSMGDVLHALPAVQELFEHYPQVHIDWVVEEGFQDIPSWHPAVKRVIPIALRRWKKKPLRAWFSQARRSCWKAIGEEKYDHVIDMQGLIKSAWISRQAQGLRHGFDKNSIKEPWAYYCYHQGHRVSKNQHAIHRNKQLLASIFNYTASDKISHGIFQSNLQLPQKKSVLFVHSTTWSTKHWPEALWQGCFEQAKQAGYTVWLPWGTEEERARSERWASQHDHVKVLPKKTLAVLAQWIPKHVDGALSVDTGLSHLVNALGLPQVALYGATNKSKVGIIGKAQVALSAQYPCSPCLKRTCFQQPKTQLSGPCYQTVQAEKLWLTLQQNIESPLPY